MNKKRILPMMLIIVLSVAALSGCAGNYSIDEPFDFNSLATENPGATATPAADGQEGVDADDPGNPFLEQAEKYVVPEDVVNDMTTKALMETYLSYPMINILCFEENPVEAYKKWLNDSDRCVEELINRDDAAKMILDTYTSLVNQQTKDHLAEDKDIETEGKLDWVEFLLLQDDVKEIFTSAQKTEIIKQAQNRDSNNIANGYAIADLFPDLAATYQEG